eukprot:m.37841 g.37841  ORF g.37841 m.37841 type:complete len:383 (-) comp10160_c0_seq7:36-1184(-)
MGMFDCLTRHSILGAVLTCIVWYTGSMFNSFFGKSAMKKFPSPMTVTIAQLLMVNIILPFFLKEKMPRVRMRDWTGWILPLTFLKLLASLSSQLSILKVPVSYAHTVKACMPIFTVILSRIFLNQTHSTRAYLSLVPIMAGVIIASVTEIEFNLVGLISALVSTLTFAVQNILSKKVMKSGVNHIALLVFVSRISFLCLFPYWFFKDGYGIFFGDSFTKLGDDAFTVSYELILGGVCNSFQTIFAFTFLSFVTPVTYSVANVAKRIVIIFVSLFVFKNPVTATNILGILVAIGGIGLYNKAKLDERKKMLMHNNETSGNMPPPLPQYAGHKSNGNNNTSGFVSGNKIQQHYDRQSHRRRMGSSSSDPTTNNSDNSHYNVLHV